MAKYAKRGSRICQKVWSSPWSFVWWGLDIVGPFLKAVGNKKYLLVGTNYFTKWVEAEPLTNIRDVDAKRFVWKNIVTQFGVPHVLISDNGLQFNSKMFRRYWSELGITNKYSTPAYPQGNGQAEAVNKIRVSGLKKRLDDAKGKWVEELPHVLWTYKTTPCRSTRETPFSMTYGRYKESNLGKVRTKLGRALLYHLRSWHWSILSRRFGWTRNTTSLECEQPK